jgi:HEAT repeat protein
LEEEQLVLEAGWGPSADADAREEYAALFPPSDETNRRIGEIAAGLQSSDEATRLGAADALGKLASKREQWLDIPPVTGMLIDALPGARGKLEENLASTLALILEHFPDGRSHAAFRPLLGSKNAAVRAAAARGVLLSGRERAIADVLPLLTDSAAQVREQSLLWILRSETFARLTEATRRDVQSAAIEALGDRVDGVKLVAINVLREIGDEEARAALEQMKERKQLLKSALAQAIAVISQRAGTRKSQRSPTTAAKPAEPAKKRATMPSRARAKTKKG